MRVLLNDGWSVTEIARKTGVHRSTVNRWRKHGFPVGPPPFEFDPASWTPGRRETYAYLLGQYLGDGCVRDHARTHSLLVACDAYYPDILELAFGAVREFSPRPPALSYVKGTRGVRIVSYWKAWPLFFPQHGPGSKLDRKIELVDWQTAIVDEHPQAFLRGLLHSDGSRCMNTFQMMLKDGPKEYSYPRYFFTNYSADIQAIFCRTCDRLGIRWSRSNWRNISISHRDSVALLDEFVGAKT
ncbi:MAG: helix-turn-helix domain-containing protein [Solirubrobacterales bacterium]|nr:helix-turn-helix domain-containing protein [Solirubrobacterales bacterium]